MIVMTCSNLTKTIKKKIVFENLNIKFTEGNIYGIYGKNGIGKTTLLKIITKNVLPDNGSVQITGLSSQFKFGYAPENYFFEKQTTIHQFLKSNAILKNLKWNENDTKNFISTYMTSNRPKDKIIKLSSGLQRRLLFGQSLINDPEILLLDEPFENIDEKTTNEFINLVKVKYCKKGLVLIVMHDLSLLKSLTNNIVNFDKVLDYRNDKY